MTTIRPATLAAVVLAGLPLLTGCGGGTDPQEECRQAARRVFPSVLAGSMSQADGQAQVDAGCRGVSATDRKAIVDAERGAAIARAVPTTTAPQRTGGRPTQAQLDAAVKALRAAQPKLTSGRKDAPLRDDVANVCLYVSGGESQDTLLRAVTARFERPGLPVSAAAASSILGVITRMACPA